MKSFTCRCVCQNYILSIITPYSFRSNKGYVMTSINTSQQIAYIHDPDTTVNFDLKVKFIGFLTCFHVRPITFLWFDIGLPYLAHECITMRWCVAYIHYLNTTLNFDLKVKFIGFLTCFRVRPWTLIWINIG